MGIIQHIAFNCRDLKRQEEFYANHFGFRRVRVFNPGAPKEFVMLRLGETCLEFFAAPDDAKPPEAQPAGFQHLAFQVDDLDQAVERLKADGIETEGIIDCSWVVEGMRVCFFSDPDGNRVELMQGYQDE